jgi:hypothetical protein
MNFEVRLLSSPYMPQNSLAGVSKIWIKFAGDFQNLLQSYADYAGDFSPPGRGEVSR